MFATKQDLDIPGKFSINANVGELTPEQAQAIYDAGAQSAYHTVRLREGIDTPFYPEVRLRTMNVLKESPLRTGGCTEPIGAEHTNEEIADHLIFLHEQGSPGGNVMKRIGVEGTPLAERGEVDNMRLFLIAASLRLCSGRAKSGGCHPQFKEMLYSGGCGFTVEVGANPRDDEFEEAPYRDVDVKTALEWLEEAGFTVNSPLKEV